MRRLSLLVALAVAAVLAGFWALGGFGELALAAQELQRASQARLAGALRALRSGQPGALAALLALGFGYGVLHAAGPGHGKLLLGAWGMSRRAGAGRLLAVALAASLAQAAAAVALVAALAAVLGWSRDRLTALSDGALTQAGTLAVGLIGIWLVWRGLRELLGSAAGEPRHDHNDGHEHHDHGHHHAHLDLGQVAQARGGWEVASLVAAVAIRPCSGALLLLVLTFQMGIPAAGIAATFAMGLGSFVPVAGAALMALTMREGLATGLAGSPALRLLLPALELAAGLLVALTAATLLWSR